MTNSFFFWLTVAVVFLVAFILLVRPLRELLMKVFGATSVWGLFIGLLSPIMMAHYTVLNNFRPRRVVFPTLEGSRHNTTITD